MATGQVFDSPTQSDLEQLLKLALSMKDVEPAQKNQVLRMHVSNQLLFFLAVAVGWVALLAFSLYFTLKFLIRRKPSSPSTKHRRRKRRGELEKDSGWEETSGGFGTPQSADWHEGSGHLRGRSPSRRVISAPLSAEMMWPPPGPATSLEGLRQRYSPSLNQPLVGTAGDMLLPSIGEEGNQQGSVRSHTSAVELSDAGVLGSDDESYEADYEDLKRRALDGRAPIPQSGSTQAVAFNSETASRHAEVQSEVQRIFITLRRLREEAAVLLNTQAAMEIPRDGEAECQTMERGGNGDPSGLERIREQQAQLVEELHSIIDTNETKFASRAAQVTAMIILCNVVVENDGLDILKNLSDTKLPLAQECIEKCVPVIWPL